MIILGLNVYHPSAAASLVRDGKIVAAVTEEGFKAKKSFSGFPQKAIEYCLAEASLRLSDVDYIAVNYRPGGNKVGLKAYRRADNPSFLTYLNRLFSQPSWPSIEEQFKTYFPKERLKAKIYYVNHQLAHLSLSFFLSGFDTATIVNFDDMGDFASTSWGLGLGEQINFEGQIHYPHSLGIFYRSFMQYLGFDPWGDEAKLLLVADGGLPRYVEQIQKLIEFKTDGTFALNLEYFEFQRRRDIFEWSETEPFSKPLYSHAMEELLGPARRVTQPITKCHRDIAQSAVIVMEDIVIKILLHLHKKHGNANLALSGHIAHNFLTISKLQHVTPFENIFVPPLANDAGSALGSAQAIAIKYGGQRFALPDTNHLGPVYSREDILDAIEANRSRLLDAHCSIETENSFKVIVKLAAIELSIGNMIGWFQGRMDFAPQSFGKRSILYTPRRDDFDSVLSHKMKPVDGLNAFGISILREEAKFWFDIKSEGNQQLQYARAFESKLPSIPSISNLTGMALVHFIDRENNAIFYSLLKEFNKKSMYPFLLDIPFKFKNIVVQTPVDAIEAMLSSQLDLLIIGDVMIRRNKKAPVRLQMDGSSDLDVFVR